MYRLLIADDEPLELEGLEWIVKHAMPDTFQIIQAANGRTAIELAEEHRPHIAVMDINMPGISGLEALRDMKRRLPDTRFVLVTAYDYFAYAQEALSLGVKEYILKPAKKEQIVGTLKRLVEEIEREKRARAEELDLRNKVSQLIPLAENELALMLMVDQTVDADAEQLSEWLLFPLDHGCAIVMAFTEEVYPQDKKKIYDRLRSFVKTHGPASIISSLIDSHIAVFLRKPSSLNDSGWRQETKRLAHRLNELARQQLGLRLSVGIGSPGSGTEGLHKSYFEAVFASTCSSPENNIYSFEELKKGDIPVNSSHNGKPENEGAQQSYVVSALHRIREQREQQTLTALDRAKNYIQQRFTEDISLEEVAEYVHLNPHYLSKIFKQQFGETFIDFVTRLRIEKAISLMSTGQMSLKEVCFEAGYKDPNYFSRVFKKITGVTPTEYRNQ
ncbi:helix-turn-helix domain-containing protein [Paenibacillus alkalitolerans]|uniref:helix-turn-helix domain-containing protein n=1 Tax=Paenibacillus alkalitolerans TaxID=2799335 RepID=UPI0018F55EEA|nr:helix-turn-helix domain-containing protein [Paenibacillus alkalitolerans]